MDQKNNANTSLIKSEPVASLPELKFKQFCMQFNVFKTIEMTVVVFVAQFINASR